MALTVHGYRVLKSSLENINHVKGCLTVKPYIPSVFTKFVNRYPVYIESEKYIYVPKHYGIQTFGKYDVSTRDVEQTPDEYWNFTGSLRSIQEDVVNSFLKPEPHDGILSLQTGGGKTVCALYIASQLKLPTIVLVHNTFLRDQWIERITSFLPNARIGKVQGETLDIENKDIVVAMLQSISMKEYVHSTFEKFGLVIVDECHHIASEAFSQAVPKLTSKYMLGLSATPERKDKLMHVINWFLGPLLYQSDTGDKVDEKVNVQYYEFLGDEAFNEVILNQAGVMFTSVMVNKMTSHPERNKTIVDLIEDVYTEKGRQILVLSDRVEHTKNIFDLLSPEVQKHACVLGRDVKPEIRNEWYTSKKILIATYQLCKEGFDVASLNTLIMATPRPDVDQIVGRILRVEKGSRKTHPLIIDIVDVAFRRQFQQRLSLYKERNYSIQKLTLE